MGKYSLPIYLVAGIADGICSLSYANRFFSEEDMQGIEVLRGASAYMREYKDNNPQEAFDYLKKSIEITSKLNENKIQELSDLEREVISISEEIGNIKSKTIYQPIFQSTADKIEKVTMDNKQKSSDLTKGIVFGAGSGFFLLAALFCHIEKRLNHPKVKT